MIIIIMTKSYKKVHSLNLLKTGKLLEIVHGVKSVFSDDF